MQLQTSTPESGEKQAPPSQKVSGQEIPARCGGGGPGAGSWWRPAAGKKKISNRARPAPASPLQPVPLARLRCAGFLFC